MALDSSHVEAPPTTWHGAGARLRCTDVYVFTRSEGVLSSRPPILLLHGFPTSSYDFFRVWDRLARNRPLLTLDFVGFGVSDKPAWFGYGLNEQADIVIEVLKQLKLNKVHLVAHDMGTSVATELLARRERGLLPIELASLTLSNGSVFIDMAHLSPSQKILKRPGIGEMFAKLANYPVFRAEMRRLFGEPKVLEEQEIEQMWDLMKRSAGLERMHQLIRYIDDRKRFARRWNGALERLDLPTLVLWGAKDPVAVLPIGEKLARTVRGSRLRVLKDLGHYPQLEGPDEFAREVETFLDELEG